MLWPIEIEFRHKSCESISTANDVNFWFLCTNKYNSLCKLIIIICHGWYFSFLSVSYDNKRSTDWSQMIMLDEGDNSTFNRLIEECKLVVWLHQDREDCLTESVGSDPFEVIDYDISHALCGNSP